MIVVDFPVGAPADVAELEYVTALQQTLKKQLRLDATIAAEDIQQFLVSRHGVRRDVVEIDELILHQLAASLAVSEVSDVKNPDQDEVSSKMKVSRSATENCSSNCDEGPQDCEMPQGFECELIAPSNTQEDKPEMLNSPSTSKENRFRCHRGLRLLLDKPCATYIVNTPSFSAFPSHVPRNLLPFLPCMLRTEPTGETCTDVQQVLRMT